LRSKPFVLAEKQRHTGASLFLMTDQQVTSVLYLCFDDLRLLGYMSKTAG